MNLNVRPRENPSTTQIPEGNVQPDSHRRVVQPHPSSPGDRSHSIYGGIASAIHPSGTALNPEPSVCEKTSQRRSHWSPSVQALLDQPTAAFPRQLLGGGLAFCLTFLVWAWFGEINEVGQARGELIPQGNVYPVHPVDLGRVAKIAVTEGSPVKAGQIIAELDPTLPAAELTRIDSQLSALELQVAQKQSAIETAREEAKTRTRIAEAETKAHETAIAQGENNLQTIEAMLSQQEEDAIALKARLQGLIPLISQSEQLVAQLQADIQAQEQRQERLVPVEEQTEQLIAQLQTDVIAQGERREFLEPLEQKSQELIAQLTVDIQAQEERLERLKPLVEEGALSKENLFQSEQALRDRRNALIRAQMAEASQAKERLFEAEQALRDRQNVLTRAQISDVTQAQERLFEAAQTLRDRTSAALRSQLSEAAQVRERVFEAEQALRTQNQRITETQGKFMQAQEDLNRLQLQLTQKQTEAERIQLESQQRIEQLALELSTLKAEIVDTQNRRTMAKAQLNNRFLYAPIDGVVISLDLKNPGEVVQPGQQIAAIAPNNVPLVLSASVSNPDAGFMETGMSAQVKLDAYPYQQYGMIAGTVTSISPNTKPDQQLGDVYKVEIALERNHVIENQKPIYFKAGQTANADIIIKKRRILDLFLDPIRQLKEDGLNF